jgi:transcriptional regulator with XRE-family HTH domain
MSDVEIARRDGLTRAQLNRIRNGHVVPRVRTALALAAALGCRVANPFFLRTPRE